MSSAEKTSRWRGLPRISFTRSATLAEGQKGVRNVQSAERLGAEFDNRKLGLNVFVEPARKGKVAPSRKK